MRQKQGIIHHHSRFIVFVVIILLLILFFIRNNKNLYHSPLSQSPSPSPESTEMPPDPKGKIVWVPFNAFNLSKVNFSMEMPYSYYTVPDAAGNYDIEMEGGNQGDASYSPVWHYLSLVIINQSHFVFAKGGWDWPRGDFYSSLSKTTVGQEIKIEGADGPENITRLPDKTAEGIKILTFVMDTENSRKFAVFKKDGIVGYISFEYDRKFPLYKDVFDHMIDTLVFHKRTNDAYINSVSSYLKSVNAYTPDFNISGEPYNRNL